MTNDRDHFSDYREQTRVKHEILEKYLKPYLLILKNKHKKLRFIDGFAGRGSYDDQGEKCHGSPMLALELIADNDELKKRVSTIFIEKDPLLFKELNETIQNFYRNHSDMRKPHLLNCEFQSGMNEISYHQFNLH
jgi:three-Cys-motif partner protein